MGVREKVSLLFLLLLEVLCCSSLKTEEIRQFRSKRHIDRHIKIRGYVTARQAQGTIVIQTNAIPDHSLGILPKTYDAREIKEQNLRLEISSSPVFQHDPVCLPMGPIGVAKNGVVIFNPFTVNMDSNNHVNEVLDECNGQPTRSGVYHYSQSPVCIIKGYKGEFVGVAFDGFPIYGPVDDKGRVLTSHDLDECHGRFVRGVYRYHITYDFPYIIGCFRGLPNPEAKYDKCSFVFSNGSIIIKQHKQTKDYEMNEMINTDGNIYNDHHQRLPVQLIYHELGSSGECIVSDTITLFTVLCFTVLVNMYSFAENS